MSFFRCPICGRCDAVTQAYNARRHELKVVHSDGSRCQRTGVDEWGREVPS